MGGAQSRDAEGRKFVLWRGSAGASSEREAVETARRNAGRRQPESMGDRRRHRLSRRLALFTVFVRGDQRAPRGVARSEEHTSELQSLRHLVCRLLLEKK